MNGNATTIAGFVIPSSDPLFLGIVAVHVLLGLAGAVTGLVAMLSAKGPGRHPRFGTLYFWLLTLLFLSATALSVMRWAHAYHLFILGALAFVAAFVGRAARRRRIRAWARVHIAGMGSSYVLMLVAFYVDNGRQLPPLNQLPPWAYWALPASVGVPIIVWALLRHPIVRRQTT
jgi:uncharacterized membrane protein